VCLLVGLYVTVLPLKEVLSHGWPKDRDIRCMVFNHPFNHISTNLYQAIEPLDKYVNRKTTKHVSKGLKVAVSLCFTIKMNA